MFNIFTDKGISNGYCSVLVDLELMQKNQTKYLHFCILINFFIKDGNMNGESLRYINTVK